MTGVDMVDSFIVTAGRRSLGDTRIHPRPNFPYLGAPVSAKAWTLGDVRNGGERSRSGGPAHHRISAENAYFYRLFANSNIAVAPKVTPLSLRKRFGGLAS